MNLDEIRKLIDTAQASAYKRTTQGHSEICSAPEFSCDCGHDGLVEGLKVFTLLPRLLKVAEAGLKLADYIEECYPGLRVTDAIREAKAELEGET